MQWIFNYEMQLQVICLLLITLTNWLPCFPLMYLSFFREVPLTYYTAGNVLYPLRTYVDNRKKKKRYRAAVIWACWEWTHSMWQRLTPTLTQVPLTTRRRTGELSSQHLLWFREATCRTAGRKTLRQELKTIQQKAQMLMGCSSLKRHATIYNISGYAPE